jgi:hypothetical protein
MGIFDFIRTKTNKSNFLTQEKGMENEVYFTKVEKFAGGDLVALAHFPNYQNDLFGIEVTKDKFTNTISTQPFYIHSRKSDKVLLFSKFSTVFKIGLRTIAGTDYLTLEAYQKDIKFLENDQFSILFEDGSIWEFVIKIKGIRKDKDSEGVLYESKIEITNDQLVKLKEKSIVKWKYLNHKTDQVYTNEIDIEMQNMIKEMALMMLLIKHVEIKGL